MPEACGGQGSRGFGGEVYPIGLQIIDRSVQRDMLSHRYGSDDIRPAHNPYHPLAAQDRNPFELVSGH